MSEKKEILVDDNGNPVDLDEATTMTNVQVDHDALLCIGNQSGQEILRVTSEGKLVVPEGIEPSEAAVGLLEGFAMLVHMAFDQGCLEGYQKAIKELTGEKK